ncbi:hypothetical protein PA0157 [Candidatus Phytoplasma australiense]|uniref:Uncharacterized protein n=1 Tax=Phytoplasma australiense TaxID=59748 RepID=B1V960_PHYAS|nr:hypothetical protein PA0157 [Candidatus Phytoplasma australiense]
MEEKDYLYLAEIIINLGSRSFEIILFSTYGGKRRKRKYLADENHTKAEITKFLKNKYLKDRNNAVKKIYSRCFKLLF